MHRPSWLRRLQHFLSCSASTVDDGPSLGTKRTSDLERARDASSPRQSPYGDLGILDGGAIRAERPGRSIQKVTHLGSADGTLQTSSDEVQPLPQLRVSVPSLPHASSSGFATSSPDETGGRLPCVAGAFGSGVSLAASVVPSAGGSSDLPLPAASSAAAPQRGGGPSRLGPGVSSSAATSVSPTAADRSRPAAIDSGRQDPSPPAHSPAGVTYSAPLPLVRAKHAMRPSALEDVIREARFASSAVEESLKVR